MTRLVTLTTLLLTLIPSWVGTPGTLADSEATLHVDLIADGRVYLGNDRSEILALNAETGEIVWRVETQYAFAAVRLEQAGIVIGTSSPILPGSTTLERVTQLLAINSETGLTVWSEVWPAEVVVIDATPSRLLIRGVISLSTEQSNGVSAPWPGIVALEFATGEVIWMGPLAYDARLVQESGPLLYAVTPDADLETFDVSAMDVESGEQLWKTPLDAPVALRVVHHDTERLYVATGQVETMLSRAPGWLAALDRWTGEVRWGTRTDCLGLAGNAIAPSNQDLAVATSDPLRQRSVVRLLAAATGETLWATEVAGFVHHAPVVTRDWLIAGIAAPPISSDLDAKMVAFDLETGQIAWTRVALSAWAGALVVDDDHLLIITRDRSATSQGIAMLDIRTLHDMWSLHHLAVGDVFADSHGLLFLVTGRETFAVSDLHVYAGGHTITAIDAETGDTVWSLGQDEIV